MTVLDLDYLRSWVGRTRIDEDLISARHCGLLAATLGHPAEKIQQGGRLPPLWHWVYFLEGVPAGGLGPDGHPARGGFMPPVPLPSRMWAGGRLTFINPVIIGSVVRKESRILTVDHKRGRSGDLVFVTVLHEITSQQGELLLCEEQDIVYKEFSPPKPAESTLPDIPAAQFTRTITPDSTMLFRYSALTFNGHRIHYDADYCREKEGYRNLVIHGPLNATMLAGFAEEVSGARLAAFSYQGLSPALLGSSLTLHASREGRSLILWLTLDNGTVCMKAEAVLSPHA